MTVRNPNLAGLPFGLLALRALIISALRKLLAN
jgi:hypothetical protein